METILEAHQTVAKDPIPTTKDTIVVSRTECITVLRDGY